MADQYLGVGTRVRVKKKRGIYAPMGTGVVIRVEEPLKWHLSLRIVRLDGEHTFQTPKYPPCDLEVLEEEDEDE